MTDWAIRKLKFLDSFYGHYQEVWFEEGHDDDRLLFCNIYTELIEVINAVCRIDNNSVQVALNHYIREKVNILDSIKITFSGIS